jgi:hypothetical protein
VTFSAYLRFILPHLDARPVIIRVGPFCGSYWVGFTAAGQAADVARYVGLAVSLSETGALKAAQRSYRRWYENQPMAISCP